MDHIKYLWQQTHSIYHLCILIGYLLSCKLRYTCNTKGLCSTKCTLAQSVFRIIELYKGLVSDFFCLGRTFLRAVNRAESSCDFIWSEDDKVNLLDHHHSKAAERYYHKQVDMWWNQRTTLDWFICQMLATFKTTITASSSMKLFMQIQDSKAI